MKKIYFFLILFFIISLINVESYENIYEYDMNDDIIISTAVYNTTGKPCIDCNCTIYIYNTYPNESIINSTYHLNNKGNGIYVTPLLNLTYNDYIYPIIMSCYDINNNFGGESREGIKVSETIFDYTSAVLVLVAITIAFIVMSFKVDPHYKHTKVLLFYSSFAFMALTLGLGWTIINNSPNNSGLNYIYLASATTFLMVLLAVIFLYFKEKITSSVTKIGNFNSNRDNNDRDK